MFALFFYVKRENMTKKVLKECIPTIFSVMMLSFYAVIDGLFIGNKIGDIGLSAINIAWPITAFVTATGVGIGIGGSILISHARGENNNERINNIFKTTITMLLCAGLLLSFIFLITYNDLLIIFGAVGETLVHAKNYSIIVILGSIFQITSAGVIPLIRNFNKSFSAMICMMAGTIVNIFINFLLIVVLEIGIRGAALGTLISQILVCIMSLYVIKKQIKLKIKLKIDRKIALDIIKTGITGFGISMSSSISLIFTNLQCLAYGGDSAVATYCVIAYIAFPVQSMLTGVGDGTQPLMSFYAGSNDDKNLNLVVKIARKIGIILGFVFMIVVIFCINKISVGFNLSEQASSYFNTGMLIYACTFILVSVAKFNLCFLNSILKTKKATFLIVLESAIISPMFLFILPNFFGINGIWLSYTATTIIMLIIYRIFCNNTKLSNI